MIRLPLNENQLMWFYRSILLVGLVLISWLALTKVQVEVVQLSSDKVNHALAFFALTYCLDNSFPRARFIAVKALPLLLYGLLIEVCQSFLPYREFSLLDLVADALGISLYWFLRIPLRALISASKTVDQS